MTKIGDFEIGGRKIGLGYPVYIVAELSANWGSFETAIEAISLAKQAGADALKSQCFTPDTICINKPVLIEQGEWAGQTYYELYQKAAMPREWNIELAEEAKRVGINFFASVFSEDDLDWMEVNVDPPAYKIASFEIVDLPLIQRIAQFKKPVILSTGMADFDEIDRAVQILKGRVPFALLHCNSFYPAKEEEIDLMRMRELDIYDCPVGFSDHTRGIYASIAATTLGANIIEKHFTPDIPYTLDSAFSLGTMGFEQMVTAIRRTEEMLKPRLLDKNNPNYQLRPGLWVVKDMAKGEQFTADNVKSLRPNHGMEVRDYRDVLQSAATRAIPANTPLIKEMVA